MTTANAHVSPHQAHQRDGTRSWIITEAESKGKEQVGAEIYVDDNPDNVETLRAKELYAICFVNSTNRKIGEPRAETWDDVYRLVHERWNNLAG